MSRRRGLITLVAGITLLLPGHSAVAAQFPGLDGAVHQGTCNRITDPVSDLTPSLLGTGERRGNSEAIPAASSFSTIPISLDALLADDHVVTTSDPEGDIVACGEIGGTRTDAGALIIGLKPQEESAVTGIAFLAPSSDSSQTDVSLFVAGESLEDFVGDAAISVSEQEDPLAVIPTAVIDAAQPLQTAVPQVDSVEDEPQVGINAAEQAYASDISSILTDMGGSLGRVGPLFENPQYGNDEWSIALVVELALWQQSYQAAAALEPPPSMADIHSLTVEALGLYSDAADDIATGLDSFDPALLNQAVNKMQQGGELINQANDLLDEFRRERGV